MELIEDIGIRKKEGWNRGERFGLFLCGICGQKVEKIKKDGLKAKQCSHACYSKTRKRRGPYEKKIISKKYVYIYKPDHPQAVGTKKLYMAKHRLMMEEKLGRYLTKAEIVHHINEDTMDNRIENLELMTASDHCKHHVNKRSRENGKFKV